MRKARQGLSVLFPEKPCPIPWRDRTGGAACGLGNRANGRHGMAL
ncbi:hypothetical protein [Neglectibacter timonensis]|nr:hypothetical protein [Neglectibacter timonensis]